MKALVDSGSSLLARCYIYPPEKDLFALARRSSPTTKTHPFGYGLYTK